MINKSLPLLHLQ